MRLATAFLDRGEDGALLDQFARHIERQIGRIDDEPDKAQPARQKIGIRGDQDMPDIELATALARGIEQIERPRAGNESKHGIFMPALGAPMQRQRRLVELAGKVAVEFGIFLRR